MGAESASFGYPRETATRLSKGDFYRAAGTRRNRAVIGRINAMAEHPLISCLMVTCGGARVELIRDSIDCFLRQEYPRRELVVVIEESGADEALCRYLDSLRESNVAWHLGGASTLGELRSRAVTLAAGEYVCQWDDDDLFHPSRLSVQLDAAVTAGAAGSLLQEHLHWFEDSGQVYWVDWRPDLLPCSLLCRREFLARRPYPSESYGEDAAIRDYLLLEREVAPVRDRAPLYVYRYHGRNHCSRSHHEAIPARFDSRLTRARRSQITARLPEIGIPALAGARPASGKSLVAGLRLWSERKEMERSLRRRLDRLSSGATES